MKKSSPGVTKFIFLQCHKKRAILTAFEEAQEENSGGRTKIFFQAFKKILQAFKNFQEAHQKKTVNNAIISS